MTTVGYIDVTDGRTSYDGDTALCITYIHLAVRANEMHDARLDETPASTLAKTQIKVTLSHRQSCRRSLPKLAKNTQPVVQCQTVRDF